MFRLLSISSSSKQTARVVGTVSIDRHYYLLTRMCLLMQERETEWGTPGPNKNPLERHPLMREGIFAQSKDMKDEDAVKCSEDFEAGKQQVAADDASHGAQSGAAGSMEKSA